MFSSKNLIRMLAVALSCGALQAQASVFRGPASGPGDILVFDAPGQPPTLAPELQGITLLPVDACGRAAFTQFQLDQCRLISDIPGASRVRLPQNLGSLYRYRKNVPGGALFGYFVVHADGRASHLAAFPGTGPQGTDDPIPAPVALTGAGDAMLLSTTLDAGGDLFLIELPTKQLRNVTADLAPIGFVPYGLKLLPTWGTALTQSGPVRFDRAGGPLEPVHLRRPKAGTAMLGSNPSSQSLPRPPAYVAPGFVQSADGTCVGVIAGDSAAAANVFVFGKDSLPVCVNDAPAPMAGPGFLPASTAGPTLALSPNGQRAAWKVVDATGECYSREVSTGVIPPEVQITGDANFTDTLNDAGVIAFFDPQSVIMLVGETNGAGGIEHADVFRARFNGPSMTLTNLSRTSGETQAPFLSRGDIETSDGVYRIPGRNASVFFVPASSGQGVLMRMDADTGVVETLRDEVDLIDFVDVTGTDFVYGLLHDAPGGREIVRVPFNTSSPAVTLQTLSASTPVLRHATSPSGYFVGVIPTTGGELLGRIFVPTGFADMPSTKPRTFGPTLGFDGLGGVLGSVRIGVTQFAFSWAGPMAIDLYSTGGGNTFVLPGV